jgi:DNA-binding phage protein
MRKVKALVGAGASLANAVRDALGERSIAQLATDRGVSRQNLTSALNGARVPTEREVAALIAELGGSADEWRQLFADAMQKRALAGTA